jgi:hypothetical protein
MISTLFALTLLATPVKQANNTVCPVLGGPVKAGNPTVVVNGTEYRVCCKGCDSELKANPAKFLKPDGTPKNQK